MASICIDVIDVVYFYFYGIGGDFVRVYNLGNLLPENFFELFYFHFSCWKNILICSFNACNLY